MPSVATVIALIAVVGVAVALALAQSGSSPSRSSTSIAPLLAPISTAVTGQTIDGIQCQPEEQFVVHIHAHLAIFVNKSARTVPDGIGIMPPRNEQSANQGPVVTTGSCFYWLHAHTADGLIHVESPVQRAYTLGEYFDIWGVPLDHSHVGPASGTVIAYLNGRPYSADVRTIPIDTHAMIQLDVNGDVPPVSFTFPAGT
jgi:hypothetical protein